MDHSEKAQGHNVGGLFVTMVDSDVSRLEQQKKCKVYIYVLYMFVWSDIYLFLSVHPCMYLDFYVFRVLSIDLFFNSLRVVVEVYVFLLTCSFRGSCFRVFYWCVSIGYLVLLFTAVWPGCSILFRRRLCSADFLSLL